MRFVTYTDFDKYTKQTHSESNKRPLNIAKIGKKAKKQKKMFWKNFIIFVVCYTKRLQTNGYCFFVAVAYKSIFDLHLSKASFFNLIFPWLRGSLAFAVCTAGAVAVDLFMLYFISSSVCLTPACFIYVQYSFK